jgi:hypothetical protein
VFADPSTGNKWEAANNAKGNHAWPEKFKSKVLPTLANDAKCVRFVLQKWHRLLFWEDRQEDDSDSGDDDSEKEERQQQQEDGEQQQEQDLEERIQRKYEAVLELLDMGIERLRQRARRRERRRPC